MRARDLATILGCIGLALTIPRGGNDGAPPARTPVTSALATSEERAIAVGQPPAPVPARLITMRGLLPDLFAVRGTTGAVRRGDHLETKPGVPLKIQLPVDARGGLQIEDVASGIHTAVFLRGARASEALIFDDLIVYPNALAGADVVQRIGPASVEDFVVFDSKPAREELVYDIDVRGIRSVRSVGDTIELLDERGSPRLRANSPWLADAHGDRVAARISVEGCAVDRDPRGPWDRDMVRVGADYCAVRVSWGGVRYPIVVDPKWTTTGKAARRHGPKPYRLPSNKILLADRSQPAELYDAASGTWAATGAMTSLRDVEGVSLSDGRVLFAGGSIPSGGIHRSAEIYNPATGTFALTGSMTSTVMRTTAPVLLASGKVLVVGGDGLSAEVYDPASRTFTSQATLTNRNRGFRAVRLTSGKVLVAGGEDFTTGAPIRSAELYDPMTNRFAPTNPMTVGRQYHAVVSLPTGKVLLAGGLTLFGSELIAARSADLYDETSGTFTATAAMGQQRSAASALLLPSGRVLIAGGSGSGFVTLATNELFDPATGAFTILPPMLTPRSLLGTVLLADNRVLAVEGAASDADTGAELLTIKSNGQLCATNDECETSLCVDGFCCNSSCSGLCEACDVKGAEGVCSGLEGQPHGKRGACSSGDPCDATCSPTNRTKCVFPTATKACGGTCEGAIDKRSACNGEGSCEAVAPRPCAGNFACAPQGTSCLATCKDATECAPGYNCQPDGKCTPSASCIDPTTSQGAGQPPKACAPYKCASEGNGACLVQCKSIDDCIAPAVCDPTGQCVTSSTSAADNAGCSAAAGNPSSAWVVGLAVATMAASRRKKRPNASPARSPS